MFKFESGKDFAKYLDDEDPLKSFRKRFSIPEGCIYLDGNSLGLMPKDSEKTLSRVLEEWKNLGISGWLEAKQPWFYFAEEIGRMASELVGAEPDEVVAAGSTTVNIHSLISTFFQPYKGKNKILADELNFPSDIYALKSHLKLRGLNPAKHLILIPGKKNNTLSEKTIMGKMTDDIALIFLSSVLYQSGQLLDIPSLTKKAGEKGIFIGFDCSHSVGVVPHKFDEWGVDFALWCSYKYLNSGPGSSAFLYINKKHFEREPLITGWFGYKKDKQFEMLLDFDHHRGAGGWQISTPGILSLSAIEGSLKVFKEAGISNIREKSKKLTSYFIYLVDKYLSKSPYNFSVGSPRDPDKRGGHIALERKNETRRICETLKKRRIITDFRKPNIIRFAPVALYNTYLEVWKVIQALKEIIEQKEYEKFNEEVNPQ